MGKPLQFVGLGVVAALAFESAIRIEDRIRFGMPILGSVKGLDNLLVRDEFGKHGRPSVQWRKWRMNNVGTRGPDVTPIKPAGTRRIVVLGASETFGLYESPGQEYPRQLEDSLRAACPANAIEVLNAGAPGMSLPTFTQDFATRLAQLDPDIVVAYPTPAQYLDFATPRAASPDSTGQDLVLPSRNGWYPRGADHLRNGLKTMVPAPLATWFRQRAISGSLAAEPSRAVFTAVPADRLTRFGDDLRVLVGTIRREGAAPVLVTHGNQFVPGLPADEAKLSVWQRYYPLAAGRTLIGFDSAAALTTKQIAADSAAIAIDFAGQLPATRADLFADFAHFTDRGAGRLAGAIARALTTLACRP